MESMRSLNTSLPRPSREKRSPPSQDQLIQAFKTAALSVTNLYKNAATDQQRVRDDGYQQALDDLLSFLDRRNIGLGDGEGWAIRQWATERLDSSPVAAGSDSDDEKVEDDKRARSNSPIQKPDLDSIRRTKSKSPAWSSPPPTSIPHSTSQQDSNPNSLDSFTFRSDMTYPHDTTMQSPDPATDNQLPISPVIRSTVTAPAGVRVEVVPRGARTPHRTGNNIHRHSTRSIPMPRIPSTNSGTKRKIALGDYFDLSIFGDTKEGHGSGGKRSRFA